jgi:hypothetical protein
MTQSYEGSRGQRNALERLGEKIHGFRGFQDRELRRDVDRMLRESLASEVTALKGRLRDRARAYTDAGRIGALGGFDRLDRVLDGLSQAIRFSDYGATGLFDAVKVGEAELERLYRFDLSLYDDLAQLDAEAAALPAPGGDDPAPALDRLQGSLRQVEEKWRRRREVLDTVSGGAGSPAAG